ncbi:MAG: maleylacetoacetate isomerase [Alphaproteobacteria bacterium]|nr:maleylacetoacetate isomerase [Alphaproteobacteria bacterium]
MRLHGYFRSSAAWRVRIALALKGVAAEAVPHHLPKGEQRAPGYLALNPQGLVPALELDQGQVLIRSLAIIEWLEESHPQPPLLPRDPLLRARVRAFALAVACEIHPVQNLRVLRRLKRLGLAQQAIDEWARATNEDGLQPCESLVQAEAGPFCFGNAPSLADICLIPQLGNARRYGVDVSQFPRLLRAEAAALALPAFADTAPERQPDAE